MVDALYDAMIVDGKAVCCRNIEETLIFFDLVKQMLDMHKNEINHVFDNRETKASSEDFCVKFDEIRFIFYKGFLKYGKYMSDQPDVKYLGVVYESVMFSDLLGVQSECVEVSDEDISVFFF